MVGFEQASLVVRLTFMLLPCSDVCFTIQTSCHKDVDSFSIMMVALEAHN
ncbi:MAG: hypothetical protein LBT03_02400 [Holosporales bacterium]|jgi:hypothetical protein|nr:hypothetical protein [Holosporales bacterium]